MPNNILILFGIFVIGVLPTGLFVYFIYRGLLKVGITFHKAEDYYKRKKMSSRTLKGEIEGASIKTFKKEDGLLYRINFLAHFSYNDKIYHCTISPYSLNFSTNFDQVKYILSEIKANNFFIYQSLDDPNDSFLLVNDWCTWGQVKHH